MKKCKHKKIKRNFPFGKKAKARMYCEDCNQVIRGTHLKIIRERKDKEKRGRR